MALTICRTKSHDLFYFRKPKKITGDIPPTPFLTKTMGNIAERFMRKAWLWKLFGSIRDDLRASGISVVGLSRRRVTLEDAFLKLFAEDVE